LPLETVETTLGGIVGVVGVVGVVGANGGADLRGVEAFCLPGVIVFLRGCGPSANL
jgi:hypothetical protein